jgi:hypothetical protein
MEDRGHRDESDSGQDPYLFYYPGGIPAGRTVDRALGFFFRNVFGWTFVIVGLASGVFGIYQSARAQMPEEWPSVDGFIVSAVVDSSFSSQGPRRCAKIDYEYSVESIVYSGGRVTICGNCMNAEAAVDHYRPGDRVSVFYSSGDPSRAVLEPRAPACRDLDIVFRTATFFVIAGLFIQWWIPRKMDQVLSERRAQMHSERDGYF